jgi:hypothetical protein
VVSAPRLEFEGGEIMAYQRGLGNEPEQSCYKLGTILVRCADVVLFMFVL